MNVCKRGCRVGRWLLLIVAGLGGNAWAEPVQIKLQQVFDGISLDRPLMLREAPPANKSHALGARRWYVLEQAGRILRLEQRGSKTAAAVFADLRQRVESGPDEAGLLGMALAPDFAKNGRLYLSYTRKGKPLVSVLSRFVSRDGGQTLDASSEQILLEVAQPYNNHNGGHLQFGPDGYLYYGLGDGGSAGDPKGNAQNVQTLLGALLRLDVSGDGAYQIPADNPFVTEKGRAEIYAFGLRNPWRWSFDRANGDLWLADVGQNAWEEINLIQSGGNYGWNLREGAHCYSGDCQRAGLLEPVAEYSNGENCSVTGGYVYRGEKISALQGVYLFGDFCSGKIWGLMRGKDGNYRRQLLVKSGLNIASFAQDRDGELYVLDLKGKIFRVAAALKF